MLEAVARGRNIFYRGYVIHEDVPTICYTIYDRRPERTELETGGYPCAGSGVTGSCPKCGRTLEQ